MAYTRTSSRFNSTPFSSCCGIASMTGSGKPDDHCHGCGKPMTHHDPGEDVLAARRLRAQGKCGLCGQPYKDCHC